MSLLFRSTWALWGFLCLCLAGAERGQESPANLRIEEFELWQRGQVWKAERESLGTARLTLNVRGEESELELLMQLAPIGTSVQRVLRRHGEQSTLIWREWRVGESGGSAISGRTLVRESTPQKVSLREWAGGAMRSQAGTRGLSTLQIVEAARHLPAAYSLAVVNHFDPLEATSRPALVMQTPLFVGMRSGMRSLHVIDLDGATPTSQWIFAGSELWAFAEGDLIALRAASAKKADQKLQISSL